MRRLMLAAGVLCASAAFAGRADSQGTTMPGQAVGNEIVSPVGSQVKKAAPAVGKPINMPLDNPLMRRYDPSRPYDAFKGSSFSASQLVAPLPGVGDQSSLHQLYDRLKSVVGLSKPTFVEQRSGYFPSLTRRSRERVQDRLWRTD